MATPADEGIAGAKQDVARAQPGFSFRIFNHEYEETLDSEQTYATQEEAIQGGLNLMSEVWPDDDFLLPDDFEWKIPVGKLGEAMVGDFEGVLDFTVEREKPRCPRCDAPLEEDGICGCQPPEEEERTLVLESNDPGSTAATGCERDAPLSEELYQVAKHLEQVIYRDAKAMDRDWEASIEALKRDLMVWIYG